MGWLTEKIEKGIGDVVIKAVMLMFIGAPWYFYSTLEAQVQQKASKEYVKQAVVKRIDKVEERIEKLDTVIHEQQRVIDRLDWYLDQQREMQTAPDSLRRSR